MSIGNLPESLRQRILAGIVLAGRLAVYASVNVNDIVIVTSINVICITFVCVYIYIYIYI